MLKKLFIVVKLHGKNLAIIKKEKKKKSEVREAQGRQRQNGIDPLKENVKFSMENIS